MWLDTIFNAVLKLNDGSVNVFVSVVPDENIDAVALLMVIVIISFVAAL